MKVIVFGATGMVGQGVLRECLLDADVKSVLAVGRKETAQRHDKLRELVHRDFHDFSAVARELSGWDACFFCLGVSSAGMSEADYQRVTYDVTVAAGEVLSRQNPGMTFIYVSGACTDPSERGRTMWARVKGKTENALLRMPFKAVYLFRPGYIQPLAGITSKTRLYRVIYAVVGPMFPVWKKLFPKYVTTTELVGRAMIELARHGDPRRVLENRDINEIARRPTGGFTAPSTGRASPPP
jgi:uncharacterized protein YbjT (DUF2867 family)